MRSDAASCLERVFSLSRVGYPRHGHSAAGSGLVIGIRIRIGAMYLSSLLTGWFVDRYGHMKIAAASGITLLAARILAAAAPGDSVALPALPLALLGLGWNLGLVSSTAIISDTVPLAARAKTQGLVDVRRRHRRHGRRRQLPRPRPHRRCALPRPPGRRRRHRLPPMKPMIPDTSAPDITVDGTGLLCVTLLLRLRKEITGAQPGTVVHVIATGPPHRSTCPPGAT